MKVKIATIVLLIILAALPVGIALADAKGPNAFVFGPAECANGDTFDVIVGPGNSVVGQIADSTRVGVAMSVSLFDADGNLVETFFARPGKQPTVWCDWESPDIPPGWHLGGDILLTPARP